MISAFLGFVPFAIWLYLLLGRGFFWLCRERDDAFVAEGNDRPAIVAVIPARDEAESIGACIGSLLRQDYAGSFKIILVDDQSSDGTNKAASAAAAAALASERLTIVQGRDLPPGWTGKLWAMRQGLAAVEAERNPPDYVLFTDADIAFDPPVLKRLVAIARARKNVLTSLMVKLRCDSAAEHWLTPAFVFFFQMLYPFPWVNRTDRSVAAAAGGCMLADRDALNAAGGLEALRSALIDDCALAAIMKRQGPIWLGLTESARSLRAYPSYREFGRMVSRSAYAELRYSIVRLVGVVLGMSLVYLAPPLLTIFARGVGEALGALTWAVMALAIAPTHRLYQRSVPAGVALPAVAGAYLHFTLASAWEYWRGRGGAWKGRVQANAGRRAT
jgi:hopene-associated glycosyltransferase HpnB